jgi:tetratricopeptide (TPR) repeat protein
VDVGALPPGAYEARAVVSFPGGELRPLQRPFRITRPALAQGELKPLGFEDIAPALPRFDPASVLRSEILKPALDQLQSRSRDAAVAVARQQLEAGSNPDLSAAAEGAREPLAAAFLRGVAAYARNEYPAAAGQLRGALRAASDFMPAAVYLGACQAAQGRDLDAAGAWQTAMMTEDGSLALRRLLAEALLRGRDAEAALGHLQEARERWPDDGGLRRTEGLALAAQGRRAEALASLMAYADAHPEDLSVLYLTTRLLFEKFVEQPAGFAERERLQRYASSYVASGGPERLVVGRWIEFIEAR